MSCIASRRPAFGSASCLLALLLLFEVLDLSLISAGCSAAPCLKTCAIRLPLRRGVRLLEQRNPLMLDIAKQNHISGTFNYIYRIYTQIPPKIGLVRKHTRARSAIPERTGRVPRLRCLPHLTCCARYDIRTSTELPATGSMKPAAFEPIWSDDGKSGVQVSERNTSLTHRDWLLQISVKVLNHQ